MANREIEKRNATPAWCLGKTSTKVKELQTEIEVKRLQGEEYHIDHIVPIHGKAGNVHVVSGLHIWFNLQLLPAAENLEKSCWSWPGMPEYTPEDIEELSKNERTIENTQLASTGSVTRIYRSAGKRRIEECEQYVHGYYSESKERERRTSNYARNPISTKVPSESITLRVPSETIEKLRAIAAIENRTLSNMIVSTLRTSLKERELCRTRKTKET